MQMNFEELFGVWNRNMDLKGMGALVFISGSDSTAENEFDFEYLTLGELRDYLTRFNDNHRFVYRWVKQAESVRGIPVVILPPAAPSNQQLSASSARTREAEVSRHKAIDNSEPSRTSS